MIIKIKAFLSKMIATGFFSIVLSNTMVKVVAFFGGMVLVRVLSKDDYGVYSYVMNAMGFLIVLGDLGTGMATLQLTQENHGNLYKFKGYCAWGFWLTLVLSIFPSLCVLLSPLYYPFTIEGSQKLIVSLFALPFINNMNTFFQTNLRIHLKNNRLAFLNTISIIIHYLVLLPMSFGLGITGAVISNYIFGGITLIIGWIINRKYLYCSKEHIKHISGKEKKEFFKLSLPTQLNSMIAQLVLLMDVFMIGLYFADSGIIASYKVATTIPSALNFIPVSIMIYAVPYFARNINNIEWLVKNIKRLLLMTTTLCVLICIGGVLTAKWLIPFIFGAQYNDAITCYVILLIGFAFSGGIQTPAVNILYTQRRIRINLIITITCGILNVVFNIIGIRLMSEIGVAVATAIVNVIGATVSVTYLINVIKKKQTILYNTSK